PWGGGGLACGIASAVKALRPSCRVLAVEVETGAPLTASLAAGSPATVDYQPSFVDGIGSKTVFASMLERAQVLLDGSVVVSLDEGAAAGRPLAARAHVKAGGGGDPGDSWGRGGGGWGGRRVRTRERPAHRLHRLGRQHRREHAGQNPDCLCRLNT